MKCNLSINLEKGKVRTLILQSLECQDPNQILIELSTINVDNVSYCVIKALYPNIIVNANNANNATAMMNPSLNHSLEALSTASKVSNPSTSSQPTSPSPPSSASVSTSSFSLNNQKKGSFSPNPLEKPFYGSLGIIKHQNQNYICMIANMEQVAIIEDERVYRIKKALFISLEDSSYDEAVRAEMNVIGTPSEGANGYSYFLAGHPLESVARYLSSGTFYYSNGWDLTRHCQARTGILDRLAWESANSDYLWNKRMLLPIFEFRHQLPESIQGFIERTGGLFAICIQGFVGMKEMEFRGERVQITLISRLSRKFAGTRLLARGLNDLGFVANMVESETIVHHPNYLFSFLIIRGSVPVFWDQQSGGGFGLAKVQLTRSANATQPAFDRHIFSVLRNYNLLHVVDLLSQKDGQNELVLSNAYDFHCKRFSEQEKITKTNFDFNSICKGTNMDRIEALYHLISGDLNLFGYFVRDETVNFSENEKTIPKPEKMEMIIEREREKDGKFKIKKESKFKIDTENDNRNDNRNDNKNNDQIGKLESETRENLPSNEINEKVNEGERGKVLKQQKGIFRVNCLDCLDRTNIVQSFITKKAVDLFVRMYMRASSGPLLEPLLLQSLLNDLWADNGNHLSMIYTGSEALKSNYTRTGKFTFYNLMEDVVRSAQRLYVNTFTDKSKQNAVDILLGKLINPEEVSLFNPNRNLVERALMERQDEYISKSQIKVQIVTWNTNGASPISAFDFSKLVSTDDAQMLLDPPSIIAIGFQEMIQLSAQQIVSADPERRHQWEATLLAHLNKTYGHDRFSVLAASQLVGTSLSIFVETNQINFIKNVEIGSKKTGMGGMVGNKGSVAIRMNFNDTSLCFTCSHLTAGQLQTMERDRDVSFVQSDLLFSGQRDIQSHDIIFWFGDFNYRIDMDYSNALAKILEGDYETLLRYDQLGQRMTKGLVFSGFKENAIKFAPTYKYDVGSDVYDTSEKMRVPSWTDRILYKGSSLVRSLKYNRVELDASDHRPVIGIFELNAIAIDKHKYREIRSKLYEEYALTINASSLGRFNSTLSGIGPIVPPRKKNGKDGDDDYNDDNVSLSLSDSIEEEEDSLKFTSTDEEGEEKEQRNEGKRGGNEEKERNGINSNRKNQNSNLIDL